MSRSCPRLFSELSATRVLTAPFRHPCSRTIIDFDKVLLLDKGRLIEYESPAKLLDDPTSRFYALCRATGKKEFAILKKMSKGKSRVTHRPRKVRYSPSLCPHQIVLIRLPVFRDSSCAEGRASWARTETRKRKTARLPPQNDQNATDRLGQAALVQIYISAAEPESQLYVIAGGRVLDWRRFQSCE